MPMGLPPTYGNLLETINQRLESALIYFEIPPLTVVKDQFRIAVVDIARAFESTYKFLSTTSRPFFIFLGLIAKYLWIVLRIISEHTIYHGIQGMKEVVVQLQIATRWFVTIQKSLSNTAIGIELAFMASLIGIYLLRKYIQRKKYVQRVKMWYQLKKMKYIRKYNDFLDQVAETSMFMALILPHLIYGFMVILGKMMLPGVFGYFANRTICSDVLSFYYPLMKTINVVHRWKCTGVTNDQEHENKRNSTHVKSSDVNSSHTYASFSGFISMRRRKNQEDVLRNKVAYPSISQKVTRTRLSLEEKQLATDASELLQYWVVYGILYAMLEISMLLPFVGSIFSNLGGEKTQMISRWRRSKQSWLDRWKPSAKFFNEFKLAFFIWLQLLPTSMAGGNDLQSKMEDLDPSTNRSPKKRIKDIPSNRPIDIVYSILSPSVVRIVSSSSSSIKGLSQHSHKVESDSSFILRIAEWCRSFLDAMVWTKLISPNTKNQISAILVELVDLAPAAITVFMPSYFTSYGVVYVQYLVPCAVSSDCVNSFVKSRRNTELVNVAMLISRYLQYWTMQCFAHWIISSFASILAWIPFSKHCIWLFWAYLQLEGTSQRFFNVIEWDLIAFGLLDNHFNVANEEALDLNETSTMKVFHALVKLTSPLPKSRKNETNICSSESFPESKDTPGAESSNDAFDTSEGDTKIDKDHISNYAEATKVN